MPTAVSIPDAPHWLPLLGHAVPLLRDPLAFLSSLPAHGDLVRIGLGPITIVVVCDLDLTRQVLRHDRIFDKGGPIFERGREVAGNGLVTCPHSAHRRQRRLLQPAFHRDRLPAYADMMTERITAITDSWSDGQILNVINEMQKLTSSTIAETLFSSTASETVLRQIPEDLNAIFSAIFRRTVTPTAVQRLTPGNRAFHHAIARLRSNVGRITAERRSEGVDREDLLSALLTARDGENDGQGLTDTEIYDQITTFFAAGTQTTATTLTWALSLLDRHPDIAQRLHTEVDTVLAGHPARHADLPRLEYTERVIIETLRLRPPVYLFTRIVTEDTELGGHRLPAGTTVAYSPYLLHQRPDLHPDPQRFDPDRWGTTESRRALIPFGDGARKCIGDTYAITEATLALATITSRWQLHTIPGQDVRPSRSLPVMHPRNLHMRATARSTHGGICATRPAEPEEQTSNQSLHRGLDS
ncbi:cytochrome P450 [Nocardia sp. NPDC050408]|uniref:cytochrome P450 n=1 Tax=Nocardia sp. NPDC050408 TaxID=3364319 RepID=UPI0037B32AC4